MVLTQKMITDIFNEPEVYKPHKLWLSKKWLQALIKGGILPKDTQFGVDYDGQMFVEEKLLQV